MVRFPQRKSQYPTVFVTPRALFFLSLFLSLFLLFFRLGSTYLVSFDEAFYAVVAKEMTQHGNMLMLTFGGERFFAASPLYIWLEMLWFKTLGASEFGVRFFAAVSSLGVVLTIWIFLWRQKRPWAAFLASLTLLSTIKFLFLSRIGNLDATLTLFTTLAFILTVISFQHPRFFIFVGLAIGLAFLSKGIFALWPLVSLILYALFYRRELFHSPWFYTVPLIFLLVTLPWQLSQYVRYGHDFIQAFYGGYMATKIGASSLLSRLWWGSGLWQGMKLWLPLSILAIFYARLSKPLWLRVRFFVFSIIIYLFALSLIQTHNDWYLMPIYPLLAIIVGETAVFLQKQAKIRKLIYLIIIFISLFHLVRYRTQYFVPQTTDAQVMMLREAEARSRAGTPILLDDFYYPIAMYYSNRPIIRLRANRDNGASLSSSALNEYFSKGSLLLTNTTTVSTATAASIFPVRLEKAHGELLLFRPELSRGKI